ncbi:MAG: UDP-N-acetylmuramate--L-alanine ligase [Candidatus Pacebacteria bacterium]|nr:UDP-N-acetylmuramate--L-alanine ligase [Candidatus Paceibacterota bacterium]
MDNLYFIGIGGIGMSALAQFFIKEGKNVSGSDQSKSLVTEKLENMGIEVNYYQNQSLPKDIDTVVYTVAIPDDHPELQDAKKRGIKTYTYPQMLGAVSKDKFTIAVSGTHGKTTTTAMSADVLIDSGLEPTVVVGSLVKRFGSNFISGDSKYFLVEACEYKRSFLNISPNILAITNIEEDHLDYYRNLDDIKDAFRELSSKVPEDGYIVCDPSDINVKDVISGLDVNIIDYTKVPDMELAVFGNHNVKNAKVAYSIGKILGLGDEEVKLSLKNFSGTWRRLEKKGVTKKGSTVIDDYAHHPSEIRATLEALRKEFQSKNITVVFQPHLFSRTKIFLKDFSESFKLADRVIVAPIYAAREKNDGSISNVDLARLIDAEHATSLEDIPSMIDGDDVVVTVGAGDVYKVGDMLLNEK